MREGKVMASGSEGGSSGRCTGSFVVILSLFSFAKGWGLWRGLSPCLSLPSIKYLKKIKVNQTKNHPISYHEKYSAR